MDGFVVLQGTHRRSENKRAFLSSNIQRMVLCRNFKTQRSCFTRQIFQMCLWRGGLRFSGSDFDAGFMVGSFPENSLLFGRHDKFFLSVCSLNQPFSHFPFRVWIPFQKCIFFLVPLAGQDWLQWLAYLTGRLHSAQQENICPKRTIRSFWFLFGQIVLKLQACPAGYKPFPSMTHWIHELANLCWTCLKSWVFWSAVAWFSFFAKTKNHSKFALSFPLVHTCELCHLGPQFAQTSNEPHWKTLGGDNQFCTARIWVLCSIYANVFSSLPQSQ